MIVYQIRNIVNDKRYVGKTKRSLSQRWKEHVRNAIVGYDDMTLYRAIRKHGPEAFELSILQECVSEDELDIAEKRWIADLRTFGEGYNMTEGGDGPKGYRHTEATKRKMSEFRKGRKLGPFSEEHKKKISLAKLGTGIGPRFHVRGWHHDAVARKKIAQSQYVKVTQYDMNNNQVAIYDSMIEAEQATGVMRQGISRCCRFPHRSAKGFRFRYLEQKV